MEDPERFQRSIRFHLLFNEGSHVLRQMFKTRYKDITSSQWVDSQEQGHEFVTSIGKKCFDSLDKSQKKEKNLLRSGNVNSWDIPLLAHVLSTLAKSKKSKSKLQTIQELKQIQDVLSLKGVKSVSSSEFPNLWDKAEKAILILGGDAQEIEKIRSASNLSETEFKNFGSINPENIEKARKLKEDGNSTVKNKDWEKAIEIYSKAINLTGLSDVDKGVLYTNRSHANLKSVSGKRTCNTKTKERCEAALNDAKLGIILRPNWSKGYALVGQVYEFQKRWSSAEAFYNRALTLDPCEAEVVTGRDACRFEARQKEEIEKHWDSLKIRLGNQECQYKMNRREDFSSVTADEIYDLIQELMNSNDPKLRGRSVHSHSNETDVPQNYTETARQFEQAAKEGNAEGMYNLGLMFQRGHGVKRDFQKAVKLFEQAASLPPFNEELQKFDIGVTNSECALGHCYEYGTGKPIDLEEAVKWYKRSSDHKVGNAASNLGFMYRDGRGVKQNMKMAKQYWTIAAERGVSDAMHSLACHYLENGSISLAQYWFNRSIKADNVLSIVQKKKFQDEVAEKKLEGSVSPPQDDPANIYRKLLYLNDRPSAKKVVTFTAKKEEGSKKEGGSKVSLTKKEEGSKDSLTKLTNSKRVKIVLEHRERIQNCLTLAKNGHSFQPEAPVLGQKGPTKLSGLKEINLGQMDLTKDHVYEGFVLSLIIVEDPILNISPSIHTIVRDEDWNVQRCYFYNVEAHEKKKIRFGTKLSVVNPHFRLTPEKVTGIQVADPRSLMFQSGDQEGNSMCRFCGGVNAGERCAKCKNVLYCDKDCQSQDLKLLKHKLVCNPELHKFL